MDINSVEAAEVLGEPMPPKSELHTIGKASEAAGVTIETLRKWDNSGRFPCAFRERGLYRYYTAAQLDQLRRERATLAVVTTPTYQAGPVDHAVRYFTPKQAAELCHRSKGFCNKKAREWGCPKTGRSYLLTAAEVDKLRHPSRPSPAAAAIAKAAKLAPLPKQPGQGQQTNPTEAAIVAAVTAFERRLRETMGVS